MKKRESSLFAVQWAATGLQPNELYKHDGQVQVWTNQKTLIDRMGLLGYTARHFRIRTYRLVGDP